MEVRFKNFVTIRGSYTQQGLSNHITFKLIKSGATVPLNKVLCIRIRRIRMFLDLLDPSLFCMDPDFFLSWKSDLNVPSKKIKQKSLEKNLCFVGILKDTNEKRDLSIDTSCKL